MVSEGEILAGYRVERLAFPRTSIAGYAATATGSGERVVLWVLESEDPHARQRFTGTARSAAALGVPHTVGFRDAGESGDRAWVAMEHTDAFTGRQWLHYHGPLGGAVATSVATTLAETIDELRLRGAPHGQVNASAILLTPGDQPVVTLAGLGVVDPAEPVTDDRFGLAAALAELLTGAPRGRVAQLRPGLPESVDAVLERGTDPVPEQRYPTAAEFARELGNALRSEREEPTRMGPEHDVLPTRGIAVPTTVIAAPTSAIPAAGAGRPGADPTPSTPSQAYSELPAGPVYPHAGPAYAPGYPQPGYAQQPGYPQSGFPQSGFPQPGFPQPGHAPPEPGRGSRRRLWVAIVVIVVLALIGATLAVWQPWAGDAAETDSAGSDAAGAGSPANPAPRAEDEPGESSATPAGPDPADYPGGCIPGARPAAGSLGEDLATGRLAVPEADLPASPGWRGSTSFAVPLADRSVQLSAARPTGTSWIATLTVGELYPRVAGSPAEVARRLLSCLPDAAAYATVSTSAPGNVRVETRRLDDLGVDYAVATAILDAAGAPAEVGGDDLQLIVVGTDPLLFALGTSPFQDDETYDEVAAALDSLRVSAR